MTASVSVIIPAYQAAHCLDACLDSVLGQSLPAAEVIVVDDGSTDGTLACVQRRGPPVMVLTQAHAGAGAARNAGCRVAGGDYVAFLDADDRWAPGFLAATTAFLAAYPETVAVSTGGVNRMGGGRERSVPITAHGLHAACVLDDFFCFWAQHDHVRTGTVLIRHAIVRTAGGQRDDLLSSQDLEYWGYLATHGPWGFMPESLWVGTSREHARGRRWHAKYQERRANTPTIESWASRIAPRLLPAQRSAFERVKGRVAAGFLHNHVLAGQDAQARDLLRRHGATMPENTVVRLLRAADAVGTLPWAVACGLLRLRERFKDLG